MSTTHIRQRAGALVMTLLMIGGAASAIAAPAASAASGCVMSGTLPAKIVINKADVIFYSTLRANAGCSGFGDLDADADFDGPQGLSDLAYWTKAGDRYRFDQFAFMTHAGTYRLEDGTALLFDADFNQVPVTWTTTKTSMRFGSRIISVATSRKLTTHIKVSAKVQRYSTAQKYVGDHTTVYLQRRASTWKSYHAYKTLKATSSGAVSYSYKTRNKYHYRFVVKDASTVWGSTSASSYR
jgi:hypothetical protein